MSTGSRRDLRRWLASLLAVVVMAGVVALPAAADDLDDERRRTEWEQKQTEKNIDTLEELLEDTDAALIKTQQELEAIEGRIPGAETKLANAEDRLAELELEAELLAERLVVARSEETSITADIESDTAAAEDLRDAVGQVARQAYKGDMTASALSAVLDATSTEEFVEQSAMASTALRTQTQALRDLEQLNGVNRNRQARLTAVREEITDLKDAADAKVIEAEEARVEAAEAKAALESLRAQQQDKLARIESKRQEQLDRKREYEQQQRELEDDLKDIIRREAIERKKAEEERRKREQQDNSNDDGGGDDGGSNDSGRLDLSNPTPLNPWVITSSYGWRIHPIYGYRKLHAGTDFRAYCGTAILAAAPGRVQWAQSRGGFGNQVMLNHGYSAGDSMMTSYNHLTRFAVSSGQWVNRGQIVGYSGTTGTSTACHLHFEVYINGSTRDPMNYF